MAEKSKRGFAAMDPAKQREIARKGGIAAHEQGRAHEFTHEQAREAGRKGGLRSHQRGTAHAFTPLEAREAGRKGGLRSHTGTFAPMTGQEGAAPTLPEQVHEPASRSDVPNALSELLPS